MEKERLSPHIYKSKQSEQKKPRIDLGVTVENCVDRVEELFIFRRILSEKSTGKAPLVTAGTD